MIMKRYLAMAALATTFTLMAIAAQAQNNSKEIMSQDPPQLVKILENPNSPIFDKAKACQRLAVVGTKDAIPALVALLSDETLNVYARCGLEGIHAVAPAAVNEALQSAAGKLQGRQLLGVLNSIGQIKDAGAVGLLKGLLSNSDASVAAAAATALGRIGTVEAGAALKDALAKSANASVGNALLTCAEGLTAAGNKAEAMALYEAVAQADLPKHQKVAALYGKFQLGKTSKEAIAEQLRAEEEIFFNLGLTLAREMPGTDVTVVLAPELDKLTPARQARLLKVLGAREDRISKVTLDAAAKNPSPEISAAALQVLTDLNEASAVSTFLDIALSQNPAAPIAKDGLKKLTGAEVDAAILSRLANGDEQAQLLLLDLAGARRIASAHPTVINALKSNNAAIRLAAIGALGLLSEPKDFDVLAQMALAAQDSPERKAAQNALRTAAAGAGDREAAAAKVVSLIQGTTGTSRDFLLEVLSKVGGKAALEAAVADAKSPDVAIRDAASKARGEWPNAEAAPALLELAKTETDAKYRIRAIRGYIRIARQLQLTDDERLAMFKTAMAMADRVDEKQLALDILTRIQSPKSLQAAVAYVGDSEPKIQEAAAVAAVTIARKVIKSNPNAVAEGMKKIVAANVKGRTGAAAKALLEQAQSGAKGGKRGKKAR